MSASATVYFNDGLFHTSVEVAGEFSNWNPIALMAGRNSTNYKVKIHDLKLGKSYMYKFIVDGRWSLAFDSRQVARDCEGNYNHVLCVTPDPPRRVIQVTSSPRYEGMGTGDRPYPGLSKNQEDSTRGWVDSYDPEVDGYDPVWESMRNAPPLPPDALRRVGTGENQVATTESHGSGQSSKNSLSSVNVIRGLTAREQMEQRLSQSRAANGVVVGKPIQCCQGTNGISTRRDASSRYLKELELVRSGERGGTRTSVRTVTGRTLMTGRSSMVKDLREQVIEVEQVDERKRGCWSGFVYWIVMMFQHLFGRSQSRDSVNSGTREGMPDGLKRDSAKANEV